MKIRPADKNDIQQIIELDKLLFKNEHDNKFDTTLDFNWSEEEGAEHYSKSISGNSVIFVAEDNGHIVGYLCGSLTEAAEYRIRIRLASLNEMFVKDEFRNKDVGKKLFEAYENWCKGRGVQRIAVTASSPNKKAIDFYKKCGFDEYETTLEKEII